jgi:aromatic ring-cleaving dioxygenase
MTYRRRYDPTNRAQVFATLRREILAARLKVTLDEQLSRRTSPKVKLLAQMKLPPRVVLSRGVDGEAERRAYDPTNKEQVFATLRREILAARLKVTLDSQLGRETSPTVERLAGMKLPPIARPRGRGYSQAEPAPPASS